MVDTFKLHIYATDRVFYDGDCNSLTVNTIDGQMGVLAHHSNMICALLNGTTVYKVGEKTYFAATSEGVMKIEDNDVLVLVDTAEHPEEIDKLQNERILAAAKEEKMQSKTPSEMYLAEARLIKAQNRLKVKDKYFDEIIK